MVDLEVRPPQLAASFIPEPHTQRPRLRDRSPQTTFPLRGVSGGEDLQMVLVADLFVRIDVDPDGAHKLGPTILFTLRLFGI